MNGGKEIMANDKKQIQKSDKPQKVIIEDSVEVTIPANHTTTNCRCGAEDIIWAELDGKGIPVRLDKAKGWISHWVDCPLAEEFKTPGKGYGSSIKPH